MTGGQAGADREKIARLKRKVATLEAMLEDYTRRAYFDAVKRSVINAMLELSLKVNAIDDLLARTMEILLSADLVPLDNRGAIFLCDRNTDRLELHASINLTPEAIAALHGLPVMANGCGRIAGTNGNSQSGAVTQVSGHYLIPLRTGHSLYGMVVLFPLEKLSPGSEDILFLGAIVDICAGAMERIYYADELLAYQQSLEQTVAAQTRELVKEKEQLAVTLRSIGDGVLATDIAGRIVLINKAAERLTGWPLEEAVGRPLMEVFVVLREQDREPCPDQVQQILAAGPVAMSTNSCILVARDGRERFIVENGAPICDEQSKPMGVVLVFRDVTDKIRVEKELVKLQKLETVGVLAGGIAHDFNNILAAILGNINLAAQLLPREHKVSGLLEEAERASLRAKKLTGRLLAFARGGEPVKEVASLREVIEEEVDFVLRGTNVTCRSRIAEDIWPAAIDRGQIGQALQNLLMNARQAMPDGGCIEVSLENRLLQTGQEEGLAPGSYLVITIADQGCGIPASCLDRIFEPFFSTRKGGSGLGLAIAHSIVAKHAGRIGVSSREGQGSVFVVYLPAQQADQVPAKADGESAPRGARVLVMDDEEAVRSVAASMLDYLGYEVELVRDGREALDLYAGRLGTAAPVDVVIMDLTIPGGMGGEKAVRELLALDPEARVIVSSGYSEDPIMAAHRRHGFRAAIAKPYQLQELARVLRLTLDNGT